MKPNADELLSEMREGATLKSHWVGGSWTKKIRYQLKRTNGEVIPVQWSAIAVLIKRKHLKVWPRVGGIEEFVLREDFS
jgi:hypothetical protein